MPSVVAPLEYAMFWVVAAGFGLMFLGVMAYYWIRNR